MKSVNTLETPAIGDFVDQRLQQVELRCDTTTGTLWSYMNPAPRACYTETMLHELRAVESGLAAAEGRILHQGQLHQVRNLVLASRIPGIYNLGGDLAHFKEMIITQNRDALFYYAKQCVDGLWLRSQHLNAGVNIIALVQGQALGGGFEGALPADVIIAEEQARFGLPEVLFNLFPGMGALSFLSRKIGMKAAEQLVYSGQSYTAAEMADLGVVDLVVPEGTGEKAVHDWIARNTRNAHARKLIQSAKRLVQPVTHEELIGITQIWVDGALNLSMRDLRVMDRLIAAQNRTNANLAIVPNQSAAIAA
jgi:DSF synthase